MKTMQPQGEPGRVCGSTCASGKGGDDRTRRGNVILMDFDGFKSDLIPIEYDFDGS